MLQPHKSVSGGVKAYQKMKSSFFVCFYVMPPLTNGGHYTHLQARLIFCDLFNLMLEQPDLKDPVSDFKQKIELDATWKYTLEELAGQIHYNRDYLRREFQRRYQISPHEYRTKKRLQDIVNLLSNTSLSIKEIAFPLGMKNASHLNIILKQHFSVTPNQIRKQAQVESGKII